LYLVNYTRLDVSFAINLLAKYSYLPIWRQWHGVKHVLHHLMDIVDMELFYSNVSKLDLIGYTDASYLLDPYIDNF